jgi:hypothetical protein
MPVAIPKRPPHASGNMQRVNQTVASISPTKMRTRRALGDSSVVRNALFPNQISATRSAQPPYGIRYSKLMSIHAVQAIMFSAGRLFESRILTNSAMTDV